MLDVLDVLVQYSVAKSHCSIIQITSLADRAMFGFLDVIIFQIALSLIYFY